MIIVTGAAGFIGSNIVQALNGRGEKNIIAVDNFERADKFRNLVDLEIADFLDKHDFPDWLEDHGADAQIKAVFHQGACSDTMETDGRYMMENNYRYTMQLLEFCSAHQVPLIYASSAAVYGGGQVFEEKREHESPLNIYGYSKFLFDQVVRARLADPVAAAKLPQVVGLRYFNVYGPRESHKGRMASVAFHHVNQFRETGQVKLFGPWDGYEAGEQSRDFVYVKDAVAINLYFYDNPGISGIFNCGTGRAQPFNDIAVTVVNTLRAEAGEAEVTRVQMVKDGLLDYIDFPDALKGKYQSYTRADLAQLRATGCPHEFQTVEQGVSEYVRWLIHQK